MAKSDGVKRYALVSVTDKSNLAELKSLTDAGWGIISTGGTYKKLQELGIPCVTVESITGVAEGMNGRVKTLHPAIFAGILARRENADDILYVLQLAGYLIDLVIVNLYAFEKKPGIEEIDIGGPSLIRAAAKNCKDVAVVVNPSDYRRVIDGLLAGTLSFNDRVRLAKQVFHHTIHYDKMIADWLEDQLDHGLPAFAEDAPVGHA